MAVRSSDELDALKRPTLVLLAIKRSVGRRVGSARLGVLGLSAATSCSVDPKSLSWGEL